MIDILKNYSNKDILRVITCSSVDDGKSTLIGRMLYDSKSIFDDQLLSLKKDTKKFSNLNNEEELDFSLLVDGLQAEREQGITIDVAYRFFSTDKRKFIIADTPGHIQYTRNMATGSSTADLAILLLDSRNGLLEQTKRHTFITTLFGIKNIIVAINKMDLINYDEAVFNKIKNDYLDFIKNIKNYEKLNIEFIPISALNGDNIAIKSDNMKWYKGKNLLDLMETIEVNRSINNDFILAIKYVSHTNLNFRGFKGKIISGKVKVGDKIQVFGKNTYAIVKDLGIPKRKNAKVGDIVCLSFDSDIDISSGDYLTEFSTELKYLSEFVADLIWMDFDELNPNKEYIIKFYNNFAMSVNIELNFVYNMEFLKEEKCNLNSLKLNQIANANFYLNKKTPMTLYDINRELGSFILIDKFTNMTVGAGMVRSYNISQKVIPISNNISSQKFNVTAIDRARIKKQKPCCLWLTGLSGSGKSTIANLLDKKLFSLGKHSFILDGDNIRFGLNSDLGFSIEDRYENIRRVGYVAKLMYDSGLIVITSFISPDYKIRDFVKNNIFSNKDFFEIYI